MAKKSRSRKKPINQEITEMFAKLLKMRELTDQYEEQIKIKCIEMDKRGETLGNGTYVPPSTQRDNDKLVLFYRKCYPDMAYIYKEPLPNYKAMAEMLESDGYKVPQKPKAAQLKKLPKRKKEAKSDA